MNTYYLDLGWEGGIVVVAESIDKAVELLEKGNSYHRKYISDLKSKLVLLKPNEFYEFMGDS